MGWESDERTDRCLGLVYMSIRMHRGKDEWMGGLIYYNVWAVQDSECKSSAGEHLTGKCNYSCGCMDGWMDGLVGGLMDAQTYVWMYGKFLYSGFSSSYEQERSVTNENQADYSVYCSVNIPSVLYDYIFACKWPMFWLTNDPFLDINTHMILQHSVWTIAGTWFSWAVKVTQRGTVCSVNTDG